MSVVENRKTRSSQIFEVTNEALHQPTEPASRLPPEYLGVPLVDNDLPGNETFVMIARRFEKQVVYRFNKQKSLYLFSPRSPLRKFVIFLTTNQYFELSVLLLIITNCILLALKDQPEEIEYVFAALYTMEMILKIIGKGFCLHKFAYLRDPWNCLDFVVVILGYLTMAPSVANLSGIRTFRVLRALRTISVIEGLRTMVNAFLRSMRMLTDVLALSLFFISTFALIGMQLFVGVLRNKCVLSPGVNLTDLDEFVANESNWLYINGEPVVCGNSSTARVCPSNYTCFPDVGDNPNHGYTSFDSFPWALLCTIQLVTADYWENVYEYIIASSGFWSVFYFLMVIFFGSFYILNLILAVVALSYQQELANLKNQEAGYNQLKATASSYSLYVAFEPQKLFPSKPSKLTSNWSSVLRHFTKTAPYYDEPALSPGPYYPSSPSNKTLSAQSPLTLDKVIPYEFDGEGLVSFYNYEPDTIKRMTSGASLHAGFEVEKSEQISYGSTNNDEGETVVGSTTKIQLSKPGKGIIGRRSLELSNLEKGNREFKTGQYNSSCKSAKDVSNSVEYQRESSGRKENDSESWNQHETIIACGISDVTSELNEQAEETDLRALGVSETGPYERPKKNDNSTRVTGSKQDNAMNINCEDSRLSHENSSQVGGASPDTSHLKSNLLSYAKTDSVLNSQVDIFEKNTESRQTEQCITDSSKGILGMAEPASYEAPVAWGKSNRKSVAEGLAMVQNTGLMIVRNSSVCVMIPRATDRHHDSINALRRICATLIMNPAFDWFIMGVIFVNTAVMAMEYHGMNQRLESTLDNINLACTFVFVLEMLVKMTAFSLRGYVQSRWNILDGFIVVISFVELILIWCVPSVTHGLGFSVLRTFRLIRVFKLAQSWVTMRALLSTIGASISQLGNLTLLLAIVTYTFAVIGMQLFSESFTPKHFEDKKVPRWNFADFLHSFMIIFRVLCGEWIEPLVMTMHVTTPTAVVFYFAVLIIGNFLILNLFLALLLNSFSTESLRNTDAKPSVSLREKFRRLARKHVNVIRAFRASGTKDKTCGRQNGRECVDKNGLDPSTITDIIPNKSTTTKKFDVIGQSDVRTQLRTTAMTSSTHSQKTYRHRDAVVPDCFPKICCKCISQDDEHRSKLSEMFIFSRAQVLSVVEHRYFDAFILFIIFISSVSLALEDVHLDSKPDLKALLNILNYVVTIIFALEFLLKLFGLGFMKYFSNAWNCLDFFIVMVSVVSLVGSVGDGNLNAFRSLRTLRALRPLRAIPRWQGMKVVVNSLLSAIPEIGNVSLVCLVFWLIFSVIGVQFFGGRFYKCLDDDGETLSHAIVADKMSCLAKNYTWKNSDINFDNSLAGFLALFQVATFEGWIEIMADAADVTEVDKQPQRDKNHVAHLYFVIFVLFGSFFVLNLFVGVIIDNFNRLKKEYESGAVGLFLTESQRAWYDTLKKAASKKPRKVLKRPKEKWRAYLFDIVNSSKFELAVMTLIVLNMAFMMLSHHRQSETVTNALDILFTFFDKYTAQSLFSSKL